MRIWSSTLQVLVCPRIALQYLSFVERLSSLEFPAICIEIIGRRYSGALCRILCKEVYCTVSLFQGEGSTTVLIAQRFLNVVNVYYFQFI